jgi:hypothetical protein
MAQINLVTGVTVGEYGTAITLTVVDSVGTAVDVSTYTTAITITARDPYALKTLTFTGSFVTTGTDGKIKFTPTSNNTFDRYGTWEGQVKLASATVVSKTVPFKIVVEQSLTV